jgi:threonine dehydrogenase-like Zn-dependent dehydrogenase
MSMRAVVYKGPHEVAVEEVDEPEIEHPNDVLVDIATTAICGSDLRMYEGRTAAEPGIVFGHENTRVVSAVGEAVSTLEEGDRVVAPFNVACGFCDDCENGYTGFCTNVNPGFAGGAYGYVAMGPYKRGQAETLRIPYADLNALKLPAGDEHEDAFALLADIFPTGWHGTELANLRPGESIAVYGAGPVGLMAADSAKVKGASEIYVVDRVPSRLELAEKHCDATAINLEEADPVEQIEDAHGGGVDRGVDAVGYRAIDPSVGEASVRVDCPSPEFGESCTPETGFRREGTRYVPVQLVEIAGLVPGAHEGRGLGNQFLSDSNEANGLVHVVDFSRSTPRRGTTPTSSRSPGRCASGRSRCRW